MRPSILPASMRWKMSLMLLTTCVVITTPVKTPGTVISGFKLNLLGRFDNRLLEGLRAQRVRNTHRTDRRVRALADFRSVISSCHAGAVGAFSTPAFACSGEKCDANLRHSRISFPIRERCRSRTTSSLFPTIARKELGATLVTPVDPGMSGLASCAVAALFAARRRTAQAAV